MASPAISAYVKLQSGKTISIELLPSDKVSVIYDHVAKDAGVSSDVVIIKYTGKVVDRNKTVGYLGIREETILKAEIVKTTTYTIYAKMPSKKTFQVNIQNTDRAEGIRDIVEAQEGLPPPDTKYIMKLSGVKITDESLRLFELGINNEAIVEIDHEALCTSKPGAEETATDLDDKKKEEIMNSFKSNGKRVEVVFSFDTTGSMYSCLDQVRQNVRETCTRLVNDIADIRIGIIAHGDYCDERNTYVVRTLDLTSNVDALVDFIKNVPGTGGGDEPEAYEWMLRKAQQLD